MRDHVRLWMLQYFAGDEPSEDILEKMNTTKEEWSMISRLFRDDDPQDDVLKWFGMPSKEDVFKLKREFACGNTFGCDFEEKMRKYWKAFKDGCKGRDVSENGTCDGRKFCDEWYFNEFSNLIYTNKGFSVLSTLGILWFSKTLT